MPSPPPHNAVLATLSPADLRRLFSSIEWVELPRGQVLHEAGASSHQVHFPVTAVVSLTLGLQNGAAAELALVGNEGVVGLCAIMGPGRALSSAVVQSAGHCWRLPAWALDEAARTEPRLMQALLRYSRSLFMQMAQLSACGRHHELQQRLVRWMLSALDRSADHELQATHDQIAHALGVRREGVTVVAQKLLKAGVIAYSRGRILVLDRAGLEALSCECYAEMRDGLARGRSQPAHEHAPGGGAALPAKTPSAGRSGKPASNKPSAEGRLQLACG